MTSTQLCILFSFIVVTSASDLQCKEAVPPLLNWNFSEILGKWIYFAGTADDMETEKILNMSDSAWMDVQPLNDSRVVIWQTVRIGDLCVDHTFYFNISKESSSLFLQEINLTAQAFPKFETCLHIYFIYEKSPTTTVRLHYLYYRTKDARDSCMAEFKQRLQCFGISPEKILTVPQLKELCPAKEKTES